MTSRRAFLRQVTVGAGLVGLGGLLQACGGGTAAPASSARPSGSASGAASEPARASGNVAAPPPASASAKAGASPAPAGSAKPATRTLHVSFGGGFAPLWMCEEIGAFKKYGLSVEISQILTNVAVPAIISGSLDVMEVSAAPVITADVNGNEDLVIIASGLNHPILGLWTAASITNAEQLKGQVIASDKPGTPVDYSAHLALSLLGLKPSDVQLRPIGSSAAITAALLSGEIDAGMEAPPHSFEVEAKGFHLLQGIYSKPYQNVGLVAKRSRLDELSDSLPRLLAGFRDGILAWNKEPDAAKRALKQYGKVTDPTVQAKTYEFFTKTAPLEPSLQPTMEGIQAMIDFLGETSTPKVKGRKAADFVDLRFLKKLPTA